MVSVKINGQDAAVNGAGLPTVADLVELIKSTIDPDHMIVDIKLNGNVLEDEDWGKPPMSLGTAIVEVETDKPASFVKDRLSLAGDILVTVHAEFQQARELFHKGDTVNGNTRLIEAVRSLKAFFEWYDAIVNLATTEQKSALKIDSMIDGVTEICRRICQQQLYQSWWAIGETLEKELEPALGNLEGRVSQAVSQQFQ